MRRIAVLIAITAGALAAVVLTPTQAHAWYCAPGTHEIPPYNGTCVPDVSTTPVTPPKQEKPPKPDTTPKPTDTTPKPSTPVTPPSGHTPVTICHHAGPSKTFTITVDDNAVPGHLGHGDTRGACAPPAPPVDTTPKPPPDATPASPPEHGHTPVTICHHAGPKPENWHTITIDDSALPAHLGHGDTRGGCAPVTPPPTTGTTPVPPPPATTPVPPPVVPPGTPTPPAAVPPTQPGSTPPAGVTPKPVTTPTTGAETAPGSPDESDVGPPQDVIVGEIHRTPRHHRGGVSGAITGPQQPRFPVHHVQPVSAAQASGNLPFTGADVGLIALLGLGSLAGGVALRRRMRRDS